MFTIAPVSSRIVTSQLVAMVLFDITRFPLFVVPEIVLRFVDVIGRYAVLVTAFRAFPDVLVVIKIGLAV